MARVKKIIGFECPICNELYEDLNEAENCCPFEADEVEKWQCTSCKEIWEDKDDAKECCN